MHPIALFPASLAYAFSVAASVLITSLWQGALLTGVVALGMRLYRGHTPAFRSALWTAVLVLTVCLPPVAFLWPRTPHQADPVVHVAAYWSTTLLVVWVAASFIQAVHLLINAVRMVRLAREARPFPHGKALETILQAASRPAVLCVTDAVNRPSVAGFSRPRILLPSDLAETLTPEQLEHVVLHEMEHLRRWDDWLNLLQQLCLVLLPLHPIVRWLDRKLSRERELACDDAVLRSTHARQAYATCLVRLAEVSLMRKGMLLALSALGAQAGKSELVQRVQRILSAPFVLRSRRQTAFAATAAASGLFAVTAVLAHAPQLVRFDASAVNIAAASTPETTTPDAGTAFARPFTAETVARPVLTRASVPAAEPYMKAVSASGAELRSTSPVKAAWKRARHSRTAVALPDDARGRRETMPRLWLTRANSSRAQPAAEPRQPRVVVTTFEISQPVYAAVPWQDGWLILPL